MSEADLSDHAPPPLFVWWSFGCFVNVERIIQMSVEPVYRDNGRGTDGKFARMSS